MEPLAHALAGAGAKFQHWKTRTNALNIVEGGLAFKAGGVAYPDSL